MTRLAIFDCDGTLVDSQANICSCMDRSFDTLGLRRPSHEAVRRLVGLSLTELAAALLPRESECVRTNLVATYRSQFFELHRDGQMDREPLYDGIAELLDDLAEEGWMLGIATGKSDRGLARVLAQHGLGDRFVTLQTADRHPSKPHPSMIDAAMAEAGSTRTTTVMIGDTSYDVQMARAAGVRAIGVTWGYHTREDLVGAGAHDIAAHACEILQMMETA